MRTVALALLLLLPVFAASAKAPPAKPPAGRVADYAAFTVPAGWTASDAPTQGDPQVRLERDLHVIKVRLSGGPASRSKSPAEFLAGFEVRSADGRPPEAAGTVEVSGTGRVEYRRDAAVTLPPPDQGGPATTAPERFCLLPAGDRFLVLSYGYGDSIPDPTYDGEAAWRAFLSTFRLKR